MGANRLSLSPTVEFPVLFYIKASVGADVVWFWGAFQCWLLVIRYLILVLTKSINMGLPHTVPGAEQEKERCVEMTSQKHKQRKCWTAALWLDQRESLK